MQSLLLDRRTFGWWSLRIYKIDRTSRISHSGTGEKSAWLPSDRWTFPRLEIERWVTGRLLNAKDTCSAIDLLFIREWGTISCCPVNDLQSACRPFLLMIVAFSDCVKKLTRIELSMSMAWREKQNRVRQCNCPRSGPESWESMRH